jgi:hypothetical protein
MQDLMREKKRPLVDGSGQANPLRAISLDIFEILAQDRHRGRRRGR